MNFKYAIAKRKVLDNIDKGKYSSLKEAVKDFDYDGCDGCYNYEKGLSIVATLLGKNINEFYNDIKFKKLENPWKYLEELFTKYAKKGVFSEAKKLREEKKKECQEEIDKYFQEK